MGSSGISVGRPLSPAPPTKAVLPFVYTSQRSPALASDRWLAPTKAENPAFCTNAFDQCRQAARLIQACLSLECRASAVQFSATGPTRNPDGPQFPDRDSQDSADFRISVRLTSCFVAAAVRFAKCWQRNGVSIAERKVAIIGWRFRNLCRSSRSSAALA